MLLRFAKSFRPVGVSTNSSKSPWILSSFLLYSDSSHSKAKAEPLQETRMRDRFTLNAKGGDGGNGCSSHRRSRHDRHGRPDGGNGGRGGDVILECSSAVWDFSGLQHHVKAVKGGHGASKNMIGTRGHDKVIQVPVGTVIHLIKGEIPSMVQNESETDMDPWELPGSLDSSKSESNYLPVTDSPNMEKQSNSPINNSSQSYGTTGALDLLECGAQNAQATSRGVEDMLQNVAELTEPGQRIIVAHGGEGGLGNLSITNFPKKVNVTKPGFGTENKDESSSAVGLPGSEVVLVLELKSIADVGLVGMPNAGKSTLLGALSRAKPAVGHYAFTTLRPNLGKLNFDDFSITVADIPGLIKGAHENRGLGHAFLRHIERTKVLAYVVDLAAAVDGKEGLPPWEQLRDLVLELEHHQEGLSDRSSLVVANKIDESGAEEVYEELRSRVRGVPIYPVCAVLEEGVAELKSGLRMLVDSAKTRRLSLDNIDCSNNIEGDNITLI